MPSPSKTAWTIEPDFGALAGVVAMNVAEPSLKQIWIWDSIADEYNVMTLSGLGDALYKATSTSSLAIGAGSKTFAIQPGKDIGVGSFVVATSDADPANYMVGQVTSYVGGALVVNITLTGGAGTHADWTIRASAAPGATGATGATGPAGPVVDKTTRVRTTANVNLSGGGLANATTHDGVTVATGDARAGGRRRRALRALPVHRRRSPRQGRREALRGQGRVRQASRGRARCGHQSPSERRRRGAARGASTSSRRMAGEGCGL